MTKPNEYAAVREVLENSIEGSYRADTALLKTLFHDASTMSGYLDGELDVGTPQPFYDELEQNPSACDSGEAYRAEIIFIRIAGNIASAGIVEENLLGVNYENHFHLLKIDGIWKIISKVYMDTV